VTDCPRENDVLELMRSGHADDDLRAHIASCAVCAEVAVVASALIDDRTMLVRNAEVPGSGIVWWRMQVRLRNEAAAVARRSMTAAQIAIVGFAVVIALVFLAAQSTDWVQHLVALARAIPLAVVIVALTAWLALAPVAAWLALSKD
jgi:hypothetical protein